MKTIVLSLGGSLIVPEKMNPKFLKNFVKTLRKHYSEFKFVVVCGGGVIARKYISALKNEGKSKKELSEAGIRATRMNAEFIMQFFKKSEINNTLPLNMQEIKNNLKKNNVVICGALRWSPNSTSDTTAVKLAHLLKTDFINITNVKGLYTKNPFEDKSAKFIPKANWQTLEAMGNISKFQPGQNFVLDQQATTLIRKYKIKSYIIGPKLKNLSNILKNKKFTGTIIEQ